MVYQVSRARERLTLGTWCSSGTLLSLASDIVGDDEERKAKYGRGVDYMGRPVLEVDS